MQGVAFAMNEHQLGRLLRRLALFSAPLPLAVLGAACGGSTSTIYDEGGAGTTAEAGADAGGSGSGGSHAGSSSGGSVSRAGAGGAISHGGAGGTISLGGEGGTISLAGAGGTLTIAGAGGGSCKGSGADISCAPFESSVPRSCVNIEALSPGVVLPSPTCTPICSNNFGCTVLSVTASSVTVQCQPGCAVGRRPAGLGGPVLCDTLAAGSYFAEIAHLEAASVTAFRVLRGELRSHGAPKRLVRAAARAARDEIRHARTTGALARRFGAEPRVPQVAPAQPRSLEAIALENAIEGCVRETYGALLATRQAEHATDPVVRSAMMRIARDETRHAALSWQVSRWLETRLDRAAQQKVARAKQAAAAELIGALANEPEVSFADLAGLPSPAEAAHLASQMQRELWLS
jgi:hypothetical protein